MTWFFLNLGKTILVFGAAFIAQKILCRLINRFFRNKEQANSGFTEEFRDMIHTLLKTLVFYGTYFAAILWAFQFFGVNIVEKLNLLILAGNLLKIIGIILGARIIVKIGQAVVERLFNHSVRTNLFGEEKRIETLKVLSKSVIMYAVYFLAVLMVLETLGVKTGSILASAGILGLAVGFGAQSLVKDVITGFFIILENYFTVGEYINAAGVGGIVEEMGLRTTKIRDWSGELHIVPNSQITMVTNHCRGKARAMVDIGIAYEEDMDHAMEILQKAADKVAEEFGEVIVNAPVVLGIQDLGPSDVIIRIVAHTKPMEQWRVERELRRRLKQALDREGIEIPYPRRVIIQNTVGVKEE
ncbi:hypothetical protein DCMF_17005 [Candidatus Formimonas warabiya]|uniref:Mechanosensitive ion channel family protein n=1 Tax=Formimonas warabiya TaxID=1761012 RepID=A0A3G1L203_FORW1|nr:hypothetical protein DCMF_17005 [Candidatus Formimonas warabiya]